SLLAGGSVVPRSVRLSAVWCLTALLVAGCAQTVAGTALRAPERPGENSRSPVDIEQFAATTPAQCAWIFRETETFGPDVEDFHKTTFQYPARSALISQGAAGYRDPEAARLAFTDLTRRVDDCGRTPLAPMFVGSFSVRPESVRIRTGASCGRDYRVQSVVLVEVTFCGFPESVPDMVMTNILARLPG